MIGARANIYGRLARGGASHSVPHLKFGVSIDQAVYVPVASNADLTLILGFAVTVLTMLYNAWNAGAERAQAVLLADRKAKETADALAGKVSRDKDELASLVLATAMEVQKQTTVMADIARERDRAATAARSALLEKLDQVKETAASALHEANNVNTKVAKLHETNVTVLAKLDEVGQHAKDAYHEANSVNNKIADLHKETLDISKRMESEPNQAKPEREQ